METVTTYTKTPPVFLELTNICNLNCPYCGNSSLTRPRGFLGRELLEEIVADCKANGHELKWLHGAGEPLLFDGVFDTVRYINREQGLNASFATNATLLNEEKARRLLDAGLRSIYISLDSIDEDVYANTRGAHLPTVITNVKRLIDMVDDDFNVHIALMDSKYQRVDDAYLERFRGVFGDRPNIKPNVINNTILPASGNDSRVVEYTLKHCIKPNQYITVTFDGKVCLCCVDQDADHCLGNLNNQTINEVWFDPENQDIFRKILLGEPGCPDVCTKACHLRPGPAETSDRDRMDDARDFFTRINPAGLPHLEALAGQLETRAHG